jgi:DNA polymerase (family 10)
MRNREVAAIFRELADILEIQGENPFRIRAYQRASQNIEGLGEDVAEIARRGELVSLPGIGKDLAGKIEEILATGTLAVLEDLRNKIPPGLVEMLEIPGLGPKMAKRFHEELQVMGVDELEELARGGKLQGLSGIRAKTEEKILKGIELFRKGRERIPLGFVLPIAEAIQRHLEQDCPVEKISVAGSVRRMRETVKDLDILVVTSEQASVMDTFLARADIEEVLVRGDTKTSVRLKGNLQVDVRVVDSDCFGSALCYFTGSKAHNIKLRERAVKMGLKVNEYGVFRGEERIAGTTEAEVYSVLGLPFIEPELREDRGEIEAALSGTLPRLVGKADLKGDLHVHSTYSDGKAAIKDIADAARKAGLQWVGVCDHSKSLRIGRGLSVKQLEQKIEEVRRVNARHRDVLLLCGAEVDILADGRLDYPDEVLKELDLVVAAIHSGFRQDEKTITERMIAAMRNRFVHMIAHPTGRLFGERDAYAVNIEQILEEARRTGIALEINAYPKRLDLGDVLVRRAKDMDIMLGIGTDAHKLDQLDYLRLGLGVARRGWLEPNNLLNTLSKKEILSYLHHKKGAE